MCYRQSRLTVKHTAIITKCTQGITTSAYREMRMSVLKKVDNLVTLKPLTAQCWSGVKGTESVLLICMTGSKRNYLSVVQ